MTKKSLKLNAVLNGIKQACTILFPLITFPYISRALGNAGYGQYSWSRTIANYFVLIAGLGVSTYAIREGAKIRDKKEQINQFCSEVFSINVVSTLLSFLAMVGLFIVSTKVRSYSLFVLIQSSAMFLATIGTDWVNNIYEDFLYITIRYILVQLVCLILMFVFVRSSKDVAIYCLLATLASYGGNLLNIFYVRKYVKFKFTFHMNIKEHLLPLLILFINSVAITIYVNSDITMLGFYASDKIVGIYSFASNIYNLIKMLINAIIVVAIPRVAYILVKDKNQYSKILSDTFVMLTTILLPIAIGMAMLSKEIIVIAGGQQYLSGESVLQVLSIATIFAIYGSFYSNCVLIVHNEEKKCLIATLISAGSNIGLNFILLPIFGMLGAAITTIFAEFVNCLMQLYFSRKYYSLKNVSKKDMLSVIISSVVVLIICYICKNIFLILFERVIFTILFSVLGYAVMLYITQNSIMKSFVESLMKRIKHE